MACNHCIKIFGLLEVDDMLLSERIFIKTHITMIYNK